MWELDKIKHFCLIVVAYEGVMNATKMYKFCRELRLF